MNITVILQIFGFLLSHKDDIKSLILSLENLAVGGLQLAGSTKADAVKGYIAIAGNVANEIEAAWPVVLPVFNALVKDVKSKAAV